MAPPSAPRNPFPVEALAVNVLRLIVNAPLLKMPPPHSALPLRMLNFERVTWVPLEIVTTVPEAPPLMIVVTALVPITFKLRLMVRFSVYVAAATLMESPDEASEIACPMVLQAVVGDLQSLLSLPLTPLTYHVLAEVAELIRHRAMSSNVVVKTVRFTIVSSWSGQLRWTEGANLNWGGILLQPILVVNRRALKWPLTRFGDGLRKQAIAQLCAVSSPSQQ
jgi:hypothetical protein